MKTQLFTNRVMTFMMPLMMLIMNLVSVGIIWFGGHAIDAGNLQTGDSSRSSPTPWSSSWASL